MRPTVALFLLVSYALAPGLITNGILKPVWSRARPVAIEQFGGHKHFTPWWKPDGDCERNCSFVSGDASSLTWLLAPASVAPPAIRPVALAGAAVIAVGLSGMRVVFGRHFFTDVVFGGVVTLLVIVLCRRLIFRLDDARIEARLERAGLRLRSLISGDDTGPPDDDEWSSTGTAKRELTVASSSRIFATVAKLQQAEAFMPRLRHKTLRNRRL